jgi:hypothetical protein
MRRVVVERVEVVVDRLDLGPLGDLVAKADEDVLDLAPRLRDQVQAPDGGQRIGGQRDINTVLLQSGVELADGELPLPGLELGLERLARLVGCRFGSSALRPRKRTRTSSSAAVVAAAAIAASPSVCSSVILVSTLMRA